MTNDDLPPLVIDIGPAVAEALGRVRRGDAESVLARAAPDLSPERLHALDLALDIYAGALRAACEDIAGFHGLPPAVIADEIARRTFRALYAEDAGQ